MTNDVVPRAERAILHILQSFLGVQGSKREVRGSIRKVYDKYIQGVFQEYMGSRKEVSTLEAWLLHPCVVHSRLRSFKKKYNTYIISVQDRVVLVQYIFVEVRLQDVHDAASIDVSIFLSEKIYSILNMFYLRVHVNMIMKTISRNLCLSSCQLSVTFIQKYKLHRKKYFL